MLGVKSNNQAAKFREEGTELLAESKFYDALVSFNKSLSFAEPGSLEMALTYEMRSETYFQGGQYGKCLGNIQAAREHAYPSDQVDKLVKLEEKCWNFINDGACDSSNDLWDFLNLSYPANEKIPFLVDCLEMREDEKFGRYVVTTKDLIPGDVIAMEESHFHFISPKAIFTKCFNCFKSNMLDLIPSSAFGEKIY